MVVEMMDNDKGNGGKVVWNDDIMVKWFNDERGYDHSEIVAVMVANENL
jgi:hypothetical protein